MDRLTLEAETEVKKAEIAEKVEQAQESVPESEVQPAEERVTSSHNSYLNSFENMTVADVKKEQEEKELQEFEKEKEELIAKTYQKTEEEPKPANIIEKPNYDFIEENKKIVKLTKKTQSKKKLSKKTAGIALAAVLGASAIVCVTNAALIDNYASNFVQVEETYNFNLAKYLKDINNLDATKKSMEFLETYPDDMLDAGSIGQKSNWFDKLCNFLGGLFGG